jgi:hypothetical protein
MSSRACRRHSQIAAARLCRARALRVVVENQVHDAPATRSTQSHGLGGSASSSATVRNIFTAMSERPSHLASPEERVLEEKRAELATLQDALIDDEEELASTRAELAAFAELYESRLGPRLAELGRLQGRTQVRAAHATTKAPDATLKALFRQAARAVHPDLAESEADAALRHEAMKKVNDAYARGDAQAIRDVVGEFVHHPDAVQGDGVGAELVRVIRKLDQARRRIGEIQTELKAIRASSLFELHGEWRREGEQLFSLVAADLDEQLARLRSRRG